LQPFEHLNNGEAETDERHGGSQPSHQCALDGKSRPQPAEMIARRQVDFESFRVDFVLIHQFSLGGIFRSLRNLLWHPRIATS
jgi:hypothetical protein